MCCPTRTAASRRPAAPPAHQAGMEGAALLSADVCAALQCPTQPSIPSEPARQPCLLSSLNAAQLAQPPSAGRWWARSAAGCTALSALRPGSPRTSEVNSATLLHAVTSALMGTLELGGRSVRGLVTQLRRKQGTALVRHAAEFCSLQGRSGALIVPQERWALWDHPGHHCRSAPAP